MALRFFALICLFPFFCQAQDNNDVIWIAETYTDLNFDADFILLGSPTLMEKMIPLKLIQKDTETPSSTPFTDALIQCINDQKWETFYDASLSKPMTAAQLQKILTVTDTITTFDPETYEEKIQVITYDLLTQIHHFRVKKVWSFNQTTGQLSQQVLSIAPAVTSTISNQHFLHPVWFRLPDSKTKYDDIENKKIQFATHLEYYLSEKAVKDITGTSIAFKQKWIEGVKKGTFKGYNNSFEAIPADEVDDLFVSTDTIFTIDPETYQETFEVAKREYHAEDISSYKVLETWVLIPEKGILQSKLKAVAPAAAVTDEYGTFDHYNPLFFWRRE